MKTILLATASVAVLTAAPALAQTATTTPDRQVRDPVATPQPSADPGQAASENSVPDVIVTATRRPVDLQKVAAVVEAVPAATLQAFNVRGVLQLPTLVSGLVVTPSGANNVYLRGIGSASTGYNEAQGAVYIDGLYLANPAMGITSFNNVDRIEVLKGPQGTLYGRNVTGGLISVTTRDPGDQARIDGSIGYANYNTFTLNFYAASPVTDSLSANIAVFHQKQGTGWSRNIFTGNSEQKSDETGVEGKLLWRPGAATKITLGLIYDYNNRDFGYAYEVYPGTLGNDGTPYLGRYRTAVRIDPSAPFHAYVGTLKIEEDLGFASLMSLSGYQTSHALVTFPTGPIQGTTTRGQGAVYNNFYQRNRTFSQEFQLTSKSGESRLDWVLGAFYYNDHLKLQLDSFTVCPGNVCPPGAPVPTSINGLPSTLSYSGYGDATYRFFSATRLTVGLRYTDESKTLAGLTTALPGYPNSGTLGAPATATTAGGVYFPGQPFPGFPNGIPTRLHFDKLTYRFVLAQDFGTNFHGYISHNLGFKSGAFNANAFNNPPALPELLYATEVGLKSQLFDNRVRLNLAYFHYTYKNVQVRSVAPPALPGNAILQNAAAERMDGVDGDFSIAAFRGFVVNGTFEFLNAKYRDFPGTTCTTPGFATVGGVQVGTVKSATCNLAGFTTPYSPKFSASLGFAYNVETQVGTFTLSANEHHTSTIFSNAEHSVVQRPRDLFEASLGWTSSDKRFDVQVWGKNLTDQYTYAVGNVGSSYYVVPGAPRTFGATVGFHYR